MSYYYFAVAAIFGIRYNYWMASHTIGSLVIISC